MEDIIIEVNGFTGQTYKKGIITFKKDNRPVPYYKEDEKYGPHHLTEYELGLLQEMHPSYLPMYDPTYFKTLTEWGYEIEQGLCKLMTEGKMYFEYKESDKTIGVWFKWVGEKWTRIKTE